MSSKPKIINVRDRKLGGGTRNICIPIHGKTFEDLKLQVERTVDVKPDFIEWRADLFESNIIEEKLEVIKYFQEHIPDIPIIYTPYYDDIVLNVAQQKIEEILWLISRVNIDIVNINISNIEEMSKYIVEKVNEQGSYCMLTTRFLQSTPSSEEMMATLLKMDYLNADIVQIVVKPESYSDSLRMLEVADRYFKLHNSVPIAAIAVTQLGLISRVLGDVFGSTLTYGYTILPTISGQMTVGELRSIHDILDKYLI